MDFIFADDSCQKKPSRANMNGPMLGIGGLHVPADQVGPLERALASHCSSVGFPPDQQFKWSPGKAEAFQRANLTGAKRSDFFIHLLSIASDHQAQVSVVIADASKGMARKQSSSHEVDVTALFLERCDWACGADVGVPIIARPGGGPTDQKKFVADCLALIEAGTEYMNLKNLAIGVLTAPSQQMRLLQLADVVTSCTVARVSGEGQFSPKVFDAVRLNLRNDGMRTGGVGLKIHPDFSYVNLYYWLLGDATFMKGNVGHPLPIKGRNYFDNAGE